MTAITIGGSRLQSGGQALGHPYLFHDDFTGTDGTLPSGWSDGHDYDLTFAPLGISGNNLACIDPTNHDNPPDIPFEGTTYSGIGCIDRETGVTDIEVQVGILPLNGHHHEAACLLHITEGTERHGVGVWTSSPGQIYDPGGSSGVFFAGYIANPVTDFGIQPPDGPGHDLLVGTYSRPATASVLTVRSVGGQMSAFFNNAPITFTWVYGGSGTTQSVPIHAELVDSTRHGVAIDTHLDDLEDQDAPLITGVWMAAL